MAVSEDGGQDIASFGNDVFRREGTGSRIYREMGFEFGAELKGFSREDDAMGRMFTTDQGRRALSIVGNELATLAILRDLAMEVFLSAVGLMPGPRGPYAPPMQEGDQTRFEVLVVQQEGVVAGPPFALLLDPSLPGHARRRSTDLLLPGSLNHLGMGLERLFQVATSDQPDGRRGAVARGLLDSGPSAARELLWIARPEAITAGHPEMEFVGCPSPALAVNCRRPDGTAEASSVGVFCRDSDGLAGVTACHHGTGPVGTPVTVGGLPSMVKHAHQVQDIVFIPLPDGYVIPNHALGLGGPRRAPPPWSGEPCQFDGCTSGQTRTHVSSHNPGLLDIDDLSQNKVQTLPSVNHGDSGSGLIDHNDEVVGFAFRRTKFGQPLQFAEWIWAANAIAAIGLRPL